MKELEEEKIKKKKKHYNNAVIIVDCTLFGGTVQSHELWPQKHETISEQEITKPPRSISLQKKT